MQGRATRAQQPQPRHGSPQRAHLGARIVLVRLHRDVVAEPLRLLVRVRMAPDVDEERGVIHGRPSLLVQPHALGEPQRDEALPEHVLHGLTETQIDAE